MGRLAGFRYRQVVKRLKGLGFQFDRQAAGSHEIWYNATTKRYTTVPISRMSRSCLPPLSTISGISIFWTPRNMPRIVRRLLDSSFIISRILECVANKTPRI